MSQCFFYEEIFGKRNEATDQSWFYLSKNECPLYRRSIFNLEEVNKKHYFIVKIYLVHVMENYWREAVTFQSLKPVRKWEQFLSMELLLWKKQASFCNTGVLDFKSKFI